MKIEFGLKRNNNFIALLGKGACSRLRPSKLQAGPEEGVGWGLGVVSGEREGLAGFAGIVYVLPALFVMFSGWYWVPLKK